MTQKTGALIFDETADRYDIRFDVNDYYGGLHCGDCMEVFVRGKWKPTRIHLLGMADTVQLGMLIGAAAGMVFCNLIIYILHLFLSFKFGLGLSLFWGVFESLQCILYSNIELKGVARYIPFAWSMNWVQDILSRQIFNYGTEKIWIAALTTGGLLLTLLWFSHWEGRKNYE